MASFDIQSGNINYAFSFQSNTGEAPWELTFSYANTEESLFASPIVNQIITGIAGTGNSVWANQYNLAIGSSSSGQVNTYINEGIISPANENIYQQNNLITGNGPTGLSGLGYSISATDDMFVIGSPFATVARSSSSTRRVFLPRANAKNLAAPWCRPRGKASARGTSSR